MVLYGQAPTTLTAMTVGARYGTGAAPSNGTSASSFTTTFGSPDQVIRPSSLNSGACAVFSDFLTGLTLNTQYWFDAVLASNTNTDAVSLAGVVIRLREVF